MTGIGWREELKGFLASGEAESMRSLFRSRIAGLDVETLRSRAVLARNEWARSFQGESGEATLSEAPASLVSKWAVSYLRGVLVSELEPRLVSQHGLSDYVAHGAASAIVHDVICVQYPSLSAESFCQHYGFYLDTDELEQGETRSWRRHPASVYEQAKAVLESHEKGTVAAESMTLMSEETLQVLLEEGLFQRGREAASDMTYVRDMGDFLSMVIHVGRQNATVGGYSAATSRSDAGRARFEGLTEGQLSLLDGLMRQVTRFLMTVVFETDAAAIERERLARWNSEPEQRQEVSATATIGAHEGDGSSASDADEDEDAGESSDE